MAILKDLNGYHYRDDESRDTVISYILQPDKTPGGFIGCTEVDPQNIPTSMRKTAAYYKKDSGVRLRHMILSFSPSEIQSPKVAYQIGCAVMAQIYEEYQTAFAVHQDTDNLHMMLHCGDPISYANLNSSYWQAHFYAYGRLP